MEVIMNSLIYTCIDSPVGDLKIVAQGEILKAILWDNEKPNRVRLKMVVEDIGNPFLLKVEKQLQEYFEGKRKVFDLSLKAEGTPFQEAVWEKLLSVGYGETCSYKQIAEEIGAPRAVRAVGAAIGRNPISIVIPCHRVIATNGSLTGFAGGLSRKKILLDLENSLLKGA
jgi:methylated-DNA-[protein]-cysteine S-methyltransferase